jgi:hypothetical protein
MLDEAKRRQNEKDFGNWIEMEDGEEDTGTKWVAEAEDGLSTLRLSIALNLRFCSYRKFMMSGKD